MRQDYRCNLTKPHYTDGAERTTRATSVKAFRKAFPDAAVLIKALGYEEVPVAQLNFKKK